MFHRHGTRLEERGGRVRGREGGIQTTRKKRDKRTGRTSQEAGDGDAEEIHSEALRGRGTPAVRAGKGAPQKGNFFSAYLKGGTKRRKEKRRGGEH